MTSDALTVRTVDAIDLEFERAGIGSRAYAFLIDWHIRLLAALAWLGLAWIFGFQTSQGGAALLLVGGPAAALYFLYHPVLEVLMQGQTPGKRWLELRIIGLHGAPPGVGALISRNVFRILDALPALYALGLLVMLCTRDQVRIGDLAAGTLVIHDPKISADALAQAAIHEGLPPRIAQLLEEWMQRWESIDLNHRDGIARTLLGRLPDDAPARAAESMDSIALRDHVAKLLTISRVRS